jgi:hypothetical protein
MTDRDCRDEMIGIKVYPDTKEEWEQAVKDDPDADTLSQLVRVAVSRHIHDRSGSTGGGISEEIHEHLTDLNTQQQSVAQRLNEINGQLKDIHDAIVGSAIDSETKELAEDIFDLLPTEQDVQTNPALSGDYDISGVPAPEPGEIEWLFGRLDAPQYQIQTALNHLQESTRAVKQTEDGQYYKEV